MSKKRISWVKRHITLASFLTKVKNSSPSGQSLCLMTIERWSHSFPFRTGQWNTLSPMIVGCISSESRTLSGFKIENPWFRKKLGVFAIYERVINFEFITWEKSLKKLDNLNKLRYTSNSSLLTKHCSLKIRIQRTDKCEHRQFRELNKHSKKLTNVRALKEKPKDES